MAPSPSRMLTRCLMLLTGLAMGYAFAQTGDGPRIAQAEVRQSPPRVAFQAGSERSETILQEIAATLKTIDGRLERIEKLAGEKKLP